MKITWHGHSAVSVEAEGRYIMFDPFLTQNPACPMDSLVDLPKVDLLILTHGHGDHVGDAVAIIERDHPKVCAIYELATWLGSKGANDVEPMNKGGTIDVGFARVSMTHAFHSSAMVEEGGAITYLGEAAGIVLHAEGRRVYHMGDTDLFGDMALINELYRPDIGLVPMGDRFTMGPESAALACNRFFSFDRILPIHHSTFPLLTGRPEDFRARVTRGSVELPAAGGSFEV